jgi:hypothetical protein
MNTIENKKELWDLLLNSQGFKQGIGVEKTREMFERVIQEIDQLQVSLPEKNRRFLTEFMKRLHHTNLDKQEVALFETRMQDQERHKKPLKDLTEIKQLLYQILDRLDQL